MINFDNSNDSLPFGNGVKFQEDCEVCKGLGIAGYHCPNCNGIANPPHGSDKESSCIECDYIGVVDSFSCNCSFYIRAKADCIFCHGTGKIEYLGEYEGMEVDCIKVCDCCS